MSLFGVFIAESYLRDHLDQAYPKEFSMKLGVLYIFIIQYGSH